MHDLKIALAQMDFPVGDVFGNTNRIIEAAIGARDNLNASIIVFPELCLSGYPPEDLLLRNDFMAAISQCLEKLCGAIKGIMVIVGYPEKTAEGTYNAAAIIMDGTIKHHYRKRLLPNYGVFDEKRYFIPGDSTCVFEAEEQRIGVTICEDIWQPGPVEETVEAGATLILNLNASPFHQGKADERKKQVRARIAATGVPLAYINLVGGQDELVFDGHSFVMNREGACTHQAPAFEETTLLVKFPKGPTAQPIPGNKAASLSEEAEIYQALTTGIRDYVKKNGFKGALLGLSGGIDSALTLALAVDALGKDQVEAVLLPSRYTADMSNEDALLEVAALGCNHHIIPIEPAFQTFLNLLSPALKGTIPDSTEENIQARCRGTLLMALSNKTGKILLTTGNKSEMSVGYATLYGDMAGGFAPLKDIPKMLVYRLSEYRNSLSPVIPARVITRAPSAELRHDQRDEDSLPPYPILDDILERYIEQDQSIEVIIRAGFDPDVVERVVGLIDRNEYKRRQAPPGVKVTRRAFGRDRRFPMTNGFRSPA